MPEESGRNAPTLGPRALARRRALLEAATKLFIERGFEKTTLSDIVDRAGGSRATLYDLFGDKEGLFQAVMEENNRRILDQMALAADTDRRSPEMALTQFALQFVRAVMDEQGLAVLRILIAESDRIPAVAEAFWRVGPDASVERVAAFLRSAAAYGQLRIEDPTLAAQAFIAMITSNMLMRRLVMPHTPIDGDSVLRTVQATVRLFLDGVRPYPQEATT